MLFVKDIDRTVGNGYWRIRIGVGHPEEKSMVVSHVLGKFQKDQLEKINEICHVISKNLDVLLSKDCKQLEQQINL